MTNTNNFRFNNTLENALANIEMILREHRKELSKIMDATYLEEGIEYNLYEELMGFVEDANATIEGE